MSDSNPNQNNPSNVVPMASGPDWKALADMYAEGCMDVEIAAELGITLAQYLEMERDIPQVADFCAKGRTLSQAWWVRKARQALTNKDLNVALFNFNMKNRFGWADKIETKDSSEENLDSDNLRSAVIRAAKKLNKTHPELLKELLETPSDGPA